VFRADNFATLMFQEVEAPSLNFLENLDLNRPVKRMLYLYMYTYISYLGTTVAQWLRCCATNRKVADSIPAGVSGFFIDI